MADSFLVFPTPSWYYLVNKRGTGNNTMKQIFSSIALAAIFVAAASASTLTFTASSVGFTTTISPLTGTSLATGITLTPGSGSNFEGGDFFPSWDNSFTITFTDPVDEVGFTYYGGDGYYSASANNGDSLSAQGLTYGNSLFFGVVSTSGFTSVTFTPGGEISVYLSDFRFTADTSSAAPEPATLALFAPLGLAGFAALRRCRK